MLEKRISEIMQFISDNEARNKSLFSGLTGASIYTAYYYKKYKLEETYDLLVPQLDQIIAEIKEYKGSLHFEDGLVGIICGLNIVNEILEYSIFEKDYFQDYYDFIFDYSLKNFEAGNYDLFYGGGGGFVSISSFQRKLEKKRLNKLFDALIGTSVESKTMEYLWLDSQNRMITNKEYYNFGLAHGMPSIWVMLANMASSLDESEQKTATNLIECSLKSIDKYSLEHGDVKFSRYPIGIHLNSKLFEDNVANRISSKLSWCYGDLSIAYALTYCGKKLGSNFLFERGKELGKYTLNRSDLESAALSDPCLCHGTTSCVLLYDSLSVLTSLPEFDKARENWIFHSENFKRPKLYEFLKLDNKEVDHYSMLTGSVGVGLVYLSIIEENFREWRKIFLV